MPDTHPIPDHPKSLWSNSERDGVEDPVPFAFSRCDGRAPHMRLMSSAPKVASSESR
jgi:hypothetical protein